jgi:tetratricopeptide (TPR) repeat protein
VKGLSVEQVAQRLDDRFRLLTGGSRTALPRHRTLRAMIEWSYDLLSEPERALLRQLTVFIGDWTVEAAEAVCAPQAGADAQTTDVLDLLLRLVDKSLITPQEHAGQTRYRMLETIGQFAHEKLSESGEEDALRARHLEYFLAFSEQAAPKLQGAEPLIWLDALGSEYENLRAALEWARETGGIQPAARLARATEQMADVQLLLGVGSKAIPLFKQTLELWQSLGDADRMMTARLHAKILRAVSHLRWRVDTEQFRAFVEDAVVSRAAVAAALDAISSPQPSLDRVRLLIALAADAQMVRDPPDWHLAGQYALSAVETAEKLDAPVELSTALGTLADVYYFRGLWRERAQVAQRRMALSRESRFGNVQEQAAAVIDAGDALMSVGQYAQAIAYLLEGESLARQVQSVEMEKWVLDLRIHSLLGLDRWDETIDLEGQLRDMQRRYPRERIGTSCFAIAAIARIHALRGERELAVSGREEADAIMTAVIGPSEDWPRLSHY